MKVQLMVAAVVLVLATEGATESRERVYCGRILANTLADWCDYGEEMPKRSGMNEVDNKYYSHAWLAPHMANAFSGSRGKRGVVTECCDKPCSLNKSIANIRLKLNTRMSTGILK
ncbi:Insulin-like polypeptide 1 [Operophtera brumata]|uniref:Insulin-like polypeptide 1 n=1 Tax=Operophtera brumata TaxID=104452 RepID=A0A0L7KQ08_OPEBR|nr:Insulin-like polypeptide 1 [Operophtera brumata]